MSDQNLGKKMVESAELAPFLEAYRLATGEQLTVLYDGESPDFICARADGAKVGVELTQIASDNPTEPRSQKHKPCRNKWLRLLSRVLSYSPSEPDPLNTAYAKATEKAEKRDKNKWPYSDDTILVLQSFDWPLDELATEIDPVQHSDFAELGFSEVWLADYTGMEAFGDVELYCFCPEEWAGYYRRQPRKPYG